MPALIHAGFAVPERQTYFPESLPAMNEERFRRITENTRDVMGEVDINGILVYASPSYRLLGYDEKDLLGRSMFEFVHSDDVHSVLITFDTAIRNQISGRAEFRCKKADGEYIWMEATGNVLLDHEGKVTGATFVSRDIMARKTAEEQLSREHALVQGILESSDAAIFSLDTDYRYTSYNRVHADLMKELYSLDIQVGLCITDLIPGDPLTAEFKENVKAALHGKGATTDLVHTEGKRTFHTTFTPIRDCANEILGVAVFARDITQQYQMEKELREQKQFLAALIDVAPIPVFFKNAEGVFRLVNRAFETLRGKTRDEMLGLSISDITQGTEGEQHERNDQELLATREPLTYETSFEDAVGRLRHLIIHKAPYFDHAGNLAGIIGATLDVSELKQSQEKLNTVLAQKEIFLKEANRQRAYFQQLFEASPDAIAVVGRKGFVVDVNRAFGDMFQFRPDELRGRRLEDLVVPPGFEKEMVKQAALEGRTVRTETTRMRKDGSTFPVSVVVSPIVLNENPIGIYVVYRDVSEQKAAEAKLRQLSVAVEQSPASVIITDTAGNIQYVNKKFTDLTGYTLEEVVGKKPSILKSGETPDDVYKNLWKSITAGGEWYGQFHNRTKFGELYWETAHICAIKDDSGTITNFLAVKEDITETKHVEQLRVHLEQELRTRNAELEQTLKEMKRIQAGLIQSEKMASIGLLTAGIAHEINNPLAFVSSNLNRFNEYFSDVQSLLDAWRAFGNSLPVDDAIAQPLTDLLSQEKQLDLEFVKRDFDTLMQHSRGGTDRIKSIVEQLRGFSHMSDTKTTHADLNKALEDTVTLSWNEIKYKATVERHYGELPPVTCNLGELKQVFVNLLVNAAHAIEPMGIITLSTSVHGKNVVIEIADTGCGIPTEQLPRIFDPFYTTKPVGKGTGLGLWISTTIIHKHGGTLSVKSAVDKGSTFTIMVPFEEKQKDEEQG